MRSIDFGLIVIMVFIISILGMWTHQRNETWKSEISLWEDSLLKAPNNTRVLVNLAFVCKREGRDKEGLAALERALAIDPELIRYFAALKYAYDHGGRLITEKNVWHK